MPQEAFYRLGFLIIFHSYVRFWLQSFNYSPSGHQAQQLGGTHISSRVSNDHFLAALACLIQQGDWLEMKTSEGCPHPAVIPALVYLPILRFDGLNAPTCPPGVSNCILMYIELLMIQIPNISHSITFAHTLSHVHAIYVCKLSLYL